MITPMMRRIWAAVCTAFAIAAVFTVLAVAHRAPSSSASGAGKVVLVRSDDGGLVPVTVGAGGAHATTQTSPASGGGTTVVQGANGQPTVVKAAGHPTTRSS
jgi:hypothetical protein